MQRLTEDKINSPPQNNGLKLVYSFSYKNSPGQRIIHSIKKKKNNASPLAIDAMTLMAYRFGDFSRFYGTTQNIKKNCFLCDGL